MYHGLQHQLGDIYTQLRETVYQFAQQEIAPLAAEIDHSNTAY